jgi:hypothetical protein
MGLIAPEFLVEGLIAGGVDNFSVSGGRHQRNHRPLALTKTGSFGLHPFHIPVVVGPRTTGAHRIRASVARCLPGRYGVGRLQLPQSFRCLIERDGNQVLQRARYWGVAT